MCALISAACVTVINKFFLKKWLNYITQGMMDNPVTEGRGLDEALLGLVYIKLFKQLWSVCFPY